MPLNVLLLDDSATIRKAMQLVLDEKDINLKVVSSTKEALDCYQENTFDMILLDTHLKNDDALSFSQQIKQEKYPNTTIIVLSPRSSPLTEDVYKNTWHASAQILKPFESTEVNQIIHALRSDASHSHEILSTPPSIPKKKEVAQSVPETPLEPVTSPLPPPIPHHQPDTNSIDLPIGKNSGILKSIPSSIGRLPFFSKAPISLIQSQTLPNSSITEQQAISTSTPQQLALRSSETSTEEHSKLPEQLVTSTEISSGNTLPSEETTESPLSSISQEKTGESGESGESDTFSLNQQNIERIASDIIERIAWEVVPKIAERKIQEHLDTQNLKS